MYISQYYSQPNTFITFINRKFRKRIKLICKNLIHIRLASGQTIRTVIYKNFFLATSSREEDMRMKIKSNEKNWGHKTVFHNHKKEKC